MIDEQLTEQIELKRIMYSVTVSYGWTREV